MSRSLLKKALHLYEQEETKVKEDIHIKRKTKPELLQPKKKRKSIVERKREAKKNKMKLKTSVQEVKIGYILDEVRKTTNVDNTERNLLMLHGISDYQKDVLKLKGLSNILNYAKGRLAKDNKEEEPKKQTKSVFTEKDFQAFERTYFVKESVI